VVKAAWSARVATAGVALLTLVGCAGTDRGGAAAADSECDRAWEEAAAERDAVRAHDLMHRSFHRCADYQEWLRSSEDQPAALLQGMSPEDFVSEGCLERDIARSRVCASRL